MTGERIGVKTYGQAYMMEAVGTSGLIIIAGLLTIWFEHPSLPVMRTQLAHHAVLRRILFGIFLAFYLIWITQLFGKRSGAHLNPSVTIAFLGLGKINPGVACMYVLMQFLGASSGAILLWLLTGKLFSHPIVNYAITEPKPPHGMLSAFIAEFIISFLMMLAILLTASSRRFEKWVPAVVGSCIALFIAVELPLSGMSLNPARSFAAFLVANKWQHCWIYCSAPILGMLLSTALFKKVRRKPSAFKDAQGYLELPHHPVLLSGAIVKNQ